MPKVYKNTVIGWVVVLLSDELDVFKSCDEFGEIMKCDCGKKLPKRKDAGNTWGKWRCDHCGQAYCQDCKSPINMKTFLCVAYEEEKSKEEMSLTENI